LEGDEPIIYMRQGDEGITDEAVNHVGVVFHAPIISYHTPHASTIPDFFIVLTPCRIASYRASRRGPFGVS